jgi:hypothetical protein
MAYIQGKLPPLPPKHYFSLNNFSGGLNNNASDVVIKENQASDLLNMDFNDEGLMEKRKGFEKKSTFDYGGDIKFIDKFRSWS